MSPKRIRRVSFNTEMWANALGFSLRHPCDEGFGVREHHSDTGEYGWWEVEARDGYRLRCDWVRTGTDEQVAFRELPPRPLSRALASEEGLKRPIAGAPAKPAPAR